MLINTASGWRSITGRAPRPIRHIDNRSELSAKMADELAELCPALGLIAATQMAAQFASALAGRFS